MRIVVQRVSEARVRIDGIVVGEIARGLLILLGIREGDEAKTIEWMTEKLVNLRIFPDDEGKMNRSLLDIGGEVLMVSQFTLYGDCRKGRRPSFIGAAHPTIAEPLYESFIEAVRAFGVKVATGQFGADMKVELINDGPVTLVIDSPE